MSEAQNGQMLHIVKGTSGEWDCKRDWMVAAYFDKTKAEQHKKLAQMASDAWVAKNRDRGVNAKPGDNPYDSKMECDSYSAQYYVSSVSFQASLPRRKDGQGALATRNLALIGSGAVEKVFWPDYRNEAYLPDARLNSNSGNYWGLAHWHTYLAEVDEVIDCDKVEWFASEEARDAALFALM